MHNTFPAKVVWMRIFLFSNVPREWSFLRPSFNCPSDNGAVAGKIGGSVRHSKMSTICHATLSHCPSNLLAMPFHHVFSDAHSRKQQCPGLKCAAKAATSLALCKQVSVLPFFVRSMSLNIDKIMILHSKKSARSDTSEYAP